MSAICMHLEAVRDGDISRMLINVPPGMSKPVHVDEPVMTSLGFKRIGDISVGDKVLTHRGRFRRVLAVHEQGVLPLKQITTFNGRVVRTAPDHPFLTPDGWVNAEDLRPGNYLGSPRIQESFGNGSVSPEEARLLGYLVGDGSISQRTLSLTNMDRDTIDDFIHCAEVCGFYAYEAPHNNKKCKASRVILKSSKENLRNNYEGELPVLAWLQKHGLYKSNSYTKFIPDAVFSSGPEALSNFLGAYWSCDGTVSIRHANKKTSMMASATTVSKRLAEDVQRALMLLGIQARLRVHSNKLKSKKQGDIYVSYNVQSSTRHFVSLIGDLKGLCSRKRDLAKKAFRQEFERDIYEDEVIEVVDAGEGECRCLTVEDDSTFTINGLIVHNSMLTSVLWPAWCWTTDPSLRFLCCSHSLDLALRDSVRCRRLLQSEWYQERWPLKLVGDQNAKGKYENDHNGFRQAVAAGSVTGARADHFIIDDPHSVESAASEAMRQTTTDWFLEAVPTRMNNPAPVYDEDGNMVKPASSIVIIMQRLNEADVSGICLEKNLGYTHLCLPMRFEEDRRCETEIGFVDPREHEGQLLFPDRFPIEVVERDERVMGPYATAGQFQQRPSPRGGGIIQRSWWQLYDDDEAASQGLNSGKSYPDMDYIIASLDTAYTEKQENDASYLTIWGVWQRGGSSAKAILSNKGARIDLIDDRDTIPCAMLMHAREMRLQVHGSEIIREPGESEGAFRIRQRDNWGLVEWVTHMCNQFKVDMLLIEAKANGLTVADEIKRLNRTTNWAVQLVNPGNADKVARAYAVQATFSNGQVWCPDRDWADKVITQCEVFPKGKHDDAVDSTTQALNYLRKRGFLDRQEDVLAGIGDRHTYKKPVKPIYDT